MRYKVKFIEGLGWCVYEGRESYGDFMYNEKHIFSSKSIADCESWIRLKENNQIIIL